ncbi:hypothetical protein LXA43DRAFT_906966 [Ganoderma leucocontextum]|nr:hypothetical protein LXA43DRAFT_906966 [Ganoderma leucocontextum]
MTSDNCCQVRNMALKVFPDIQVVQDVWHFLMRYLICVKDGTKNPHWAEVANDIVDAILKAKAANGVPAIYHSQPEQERRLVEAFNKWKEHGDVWTAAAVKVHAKQLIHVQKGCLTRPRDDIATDGSRIEGSHKGWNSIMRSFASGLEVMNALGHDHVLRHNVCLDMADEALDRSMFLYHTYGSHHIRLTNACAKLWNSLLEAQKKSTPQPTNLRPLPELCPADSHEKFGLVKMSAETATQYSLASIKQESGDDTINLSLHELLDADRVLQEIGIDPSLLNMPATEPPPPPGPSEDAAPNVGVKGKSPQPPHIASTSPVAIASTSTSAPATMPSSSSTLPMLDSLPAAQSSSPAAPMPGTSNVGLSRTSTIPTPGTPATAALVSGAFAVAPSPASTIAAPGAPIIATSLFSTVTSPSSFIIPTPGAPTSTEGAAPSTPPALDSPPPRKKACLTVAGTPAPLKTRQNTSQDPSSSSSMMRGQHGNPGTLDALFARISTMNATTGGTPLNLTPTNEPCLPCPAIVGLTRSQRLFSVVTQVDPRSLTFNKGGSSREFFLFMRLRATHRWAMFQMSPYDWVCAASTYNTAIKNMNHKQGTSLPLKTPRALLDKLSEVEAQIFSRIWDNNYVSRSGQTEFWEYHCKAVYLGSKIQRMVDDAAFKMGKNHVCGRCKRIMDPEGKNHQDNHSRNVCIDGVQQSPEKVHLVINGTSRDFVEHPPPFPQPKDVFTDGNVFHPARFMQIVRMFYDRIVINNSIPGALAMHDYAFAALLYDRTVIVPGLDGRPSKVIFKLFHSFKLALGEAAVLDDHEGEIYLRMDCLSEPPLKVMQDAAAVGASGAPERAGMA